MLNIFIYEVSNFPVTIKKKKNAVCKDRTSFLF